MKKRILCLAMTLFMAVGFAMPAHAQDFVGGDNWAVTFTGDDNQRHTIYMYPSDTTGKPLFLDGIFYKQFETCKFNLIDCGWD